MTDPIEREDTDEVPLTERPERLEQPASPDAPDAHDPADAVVAPTDIETTVNMTGDLDSTVNLTGGTVVIPERDDATVTSEVTRAHLKGLLEALVFASDKPMKTGRARESGDRAGEASEGAARGAEGPSTRRAGCSSTRWRADGSSARTRVRAVRPRLDEAAPGEAHARADRDARDPRLPPADHPPRGRRHPRGRLRTGAEAPARTRPGSHPRQEGRAGAADACTARRRSFSSSSGSSRSAICRPCASSRS